MYSFTAVIYISAVIAFVLLYQNEARKSTTETIILPYDFSGNDGYTCQMISRVTGTYQIPSSLDPSLAYNLANIMESKSQCESDLQVANPCGTPMVYFPGTASSFGAPGTAYGAAAIFHEHVVYMFDTSDAEITINSYDYSTGTYFSGEFYPVPVPITTSLAVNKFGSPIYLSRSLNSSTVQVRQADPADISLAEFENGSPNTIILNDNLYNIYVAVNNTFIYVNIYAHPVVSTVIFSLAEGDNILHAAVHHDGSSPTVFFYSTLGAPTHTYYQYKDNSITAYDEILPPNYIVSGLVTDGDYVYFCEASTIRESKHFRTYFILHICFVLFNYMLCFLLMNRHLLCASVCSRRAVLRKCADNNPAVHPGAARLCHQPQRQSRLHCAAQHCPGGGLDDGICGRGALHGCGTCTADAGLRSRVLCLWR